jgi:hypothetical protein
VTSVEQPLRGPRNTEFTKEVRAMSNDGAWYVFFSALIAFGALIGAVIATVVWFLI